MLVGDILYRFRGDFSNLDKGAEESSKILEETGESSDGLRDKFANLQNTTSQLGGVFASVFASVMAGGLAAFLKNVSLTAARTQVLGTTLLVVGQNAAYNRKELIKYEQGLKSLGITTQVARSVMVKMIQTHLNLADAEKLADAARNLAVTSGKNTSETLNILVHGLVTMQSETLRTAGITLQLEEVFKKWGLANDVIFKQMTMTQKQQALLNAVVEQATALSGAYVTAQKDLGKQLASFARYSEEAANVFGEFYLPALLEVVLATRDLLKWYQSLDYELRRAISTVAVFVSGVGVLSAVIISFLTLKVLIVALFKAAAIAITGAIVAFGALGVAVVAFVALYSTNMWGVQDATKDMKSTLVAEFRAVVLTINNMAGSIATTLKYVFQMFNQPWKAGVLFYDLQEELHRLNSEVVESWKDVWGEYEGASERIIAREKKLAKERLSNLELKKGMKALDDEQKKARDVLKDYGIKTNLELVTNLRTLNGVELAEFVKKEKAKFDLAKSLTKQALEIKSRYIKGLYALHVKELKAAATFEKKKLDLMKETGEKGEKEVLERTYELNKKLLEDEIALKEQNLEDVLDLMDKQRKPKTDIEVAELKAKQEIEELKIKLTTERLKQDAALYKLSASEKEKADKSYLEALKHEHAMTAAEDQKAVTANEMSHSDSLKRKSERDREAQGVYVISLHERLVVLQEAGKEESEEYEKLFEEYVQALHKKEVANEEHQNRILSAEVKEEEKRSDIVIKLRNEVQESQFKSNTAKRVFQLHHASLQEIAEMERRVKQGQVPYAEFLAWKVTKEEETAEAIRGVQLESQKDTDEYLQYRIDQMAAAGATEKEIFAEVFRIKKEHATSFAEGWQLGLEEMLLDMYTWADMSSEIVQTFANSASAAIGDSLFDMIKDGSMDIYAVMENLGEVMLRTITQALAKMAVQWLINQIASTTYSSMAQAGLAAEQKQVIALIASYKALAAAKALAGVTGAVAGGAAGAAGGAAGGTGPHLGANMGGGATTAFGMAEGGKIPGYGGGDVVPVMAEKGEYFIDKVMTKKYLPVLKAISRNTFPVFQGYQEGGQVEPARPSDRAITIQSAPPEITVVNVTDPQEALKVLSTRPGEEVILNVLGRRAQTVRRLFR